MDTVRFGRALGFGARSAAKMLIETVDAATTSNPTRKLSVPASSGQPAACRDGHRRDLPTTSEFARSAARPLEGLRRFRKTAVRPFVRLSGVLFLELAGAFFGIFALYGLSILWQVRGGWRTAALNHRQFIVGMLMTVVFGYFCISSFLRARRREQQRRMRRLGGPREFQS